MDVLQEWPEPVVPVQSLSDSGLTSIPAKYVKPPSNRPSLQPHPHLDVVDEALNIPVVDLHGLSVGSADGRATVQAIADACKEWGFFQVINHGVRPDLVDEMRGAWREFFHLPSEEKRAYANSPRTYEGYGSRVGVERDAALDWGDYYFLHLFPQSIKSHDKYWPARPSALRKITEAYGGEVAQLCGVLLRAMSMGLGLEEGYLGNAFGGRDDDDGGVGACIRVNLYPRCPQPELTLGLSPHSDPGGLTVLLPDDLVAGLQVRKGDEWVTVRPVPGAFVVNVGDQIQVISNAMYKSVEHRVTANPNDERLSIALFYNPDGNVAIGPARELVTPQRPPLYPSLTFNEYRMFVRKKGLRGKSQVESLKVVNN